MFLCDNHIESAWRVFYAWDLRIAIMKSDRINILNYDIFSPLAYKRGKVCLEVASLVVALKKLDLKMVLACANNVRSITNQQLSA
jgi:hypothetical protein